MIRGTRKIPFAWALPIFAFLALHYAQLIGDLNGRYFSKTGDGLKNYYTAWYHVAHDSDYGWFEGMNYPYGEYPVFTDAQPLVSNSLKFISEHVVDIGDQTVGILHFLLLFSFLLTAWYLYQIFLRFGVEEWMAVLAAGAITLLSPQMHRMVGHFALAYSFFVPLFWYLWLRFFEAPNKLRSLRIGLLLFAFAWIHPYYAMIGGLFGLALWLVFFLRKQPRKPWTFYLHAVVQILLPLILFQIWLKIADPVADRPESPWGHTAYNTQFKTLFFPMYIPGLRWMRAWVPPVRPGQWEGAAYLGLAAGLTSLAIAGGILRKMLRPAKGFKARLHAAFSMRGDQGMKLSLGAAFLLLLLAMGFPFSIDPEISTELFPPIKQFRSMGRFAWVFYYVWMVYCFRFLYLHHRKWRWQGKKTLAWALLGGALAFTFYEGWEFHRFLSAKADPGKIAGLNTPVEDAPYTAWTQELRPEQFQGLLVLPYFHYGSENFSTVSEKGILPAFAASLRSGLPLVNVMGSRTSFSQSYQQLQAILQPVWQAPGNFAEDSRPLLVMVVDTPSGRFAGEHLWKGQKLLWQRENIRLFAYRGTPLPLPVSDRDTLLSVDFGEKDHISGSIKEVFPKIVDHSQKQVVWEGKLPGKAGEKVMLDLLLKQDADLLPTLEIRIDEVLASGEGQKIAGAFVNEWLIALEGSLGQVQKEFPMPASGNPIRVWIKPHKRIKNQGALARFQLLQKAQ